MIRGDDLGRVHKGKGYGAVNRLKCPATILGMDGIHPGSSGGFSKQLPLLELRLILVISRAAQCVVYGGPGFKWELRADCYSFNCRGGLSSADYLPNISPQVADFD